MPLHAQQVGKGPDLVLLHGWGMHAGIFQPLVEQLAEEFCITLIDLPGHGHSDEAERCDIDSYVDALLAAAPDRAIWLGWSLGGMLATAVASRYPDRVSALLLMASSPRFVVDEDWPQAMQPDVLASFGQSLLDDVEATIKRFLSLVARGAPDKQQLRELRKQVLAEQRPTQQGLACGMDFLSSLDVRDEFRALAMPVMAIMGERDTLVPVEVVADMRALNSRSEMHVIAQAGHAPFLSHPNECAERIKTFQL